MIFPDDYEDQADEDERPMPDMPHVYPAENCSVCNKPDCTRGCMHCGKPVCTAEKYMEDSTCGGWIMDWWSNGAMDPDEGNEFWCKPCLVEEYGVTPTSEETASTEPLPVVWSAPAPALPVAAGQSDDFDPFLDSDDLP